MTFASKRLLVLILVSVTLAASLSACGLLIVGGAVMVAIDRRTTGTQIDDQNIELRTANGVASSLGDRGHVNVVSYNRRVLLTGEVPTLADKQRVEQIAASQESVKWVVNELAVQGGSTLSQRSNDSLITGRVKAALIDTKNLNVNAFKVVTERGIVYLMGRVTQREADRASDIARTVPGVQKVVRVFEIITEEELRALAPPLAPAETPKSSP
jgi:osmotically-inducible protein OsmY